jgi:hypothetical protein
MTVDIKEDKSIPPGYTYKRCDTYTAEELIVSCSTDERGGFAKRGWRNPYAVEYVRRNPKAKYTLEDKMAIWEMAARMVDLRIAFGKRDAKRTT